MEGWFSRDDQQKLTSSLLAQWNCYASSQDTLTGTFNVVSKGVRDIPGNFQSATSSVPSAKALVYFSLLLVSRVFFIFIVFTLFLHVMVIMPQKFAICFTLGCGFIIGPFFALKGPKNQLVAHMFSRERVIYAVWLVPYMYQWCATATFYPLYSLWYMYQFHLSLKSSNVFLGYFVLPFVFLLVFVMTF